MSFLLNSIFESAIITFFIFTMLTIIEAFGVATRGGCYEWFKKNTNITRLILPAIATAPGCHGEFLISSLYIHGLIGFATTVGGLISATGDEAFIMIVLFPKKALLLFLILFIIGVITPYLISIFIRRPTERLEFICSTELIHKEEIQPQKRIFSGLNDLKNKSKWILLSISIIILVISILNVETIIKENWERYSLIILSTISGLILLFSNEHFIKEHIVKHILKNHIWKIYLWTLGSIIFIEIFIPIFKLETILKHHYFIILMTAVAIGIIPESGPHIIFTILFVNGALPFSILIANSVVQDGHGLLPIVSSSIKDALSIKIIKIIIGVIIGIFGFSLGF
ncbi:MAG: putative manganese transporter [bacterium]